MHGTNGRALTATLCLALAMLSAGCVKQEETRPESEQVVESQTEEMAQIIARADDLSLELSIENLDGKVVNVPEAVLRDVPPGPHYVGVKIDYKPLSPTVLLFGITTIGAVANKANAKVIHTSVSFEAKPGRRYHITGAMEDGKPTIWVQDDETEEIVSEKAR